MTLALFNLFSIDGRIGRREYWLTYAALAAGFIALQDAPEWLLWVAGAASTWLGLAAAVKRLHDCGRSAYWLLLHLVWVVPAIVVPVGLLFAGFRREGVLVFLVMSFLWSLWWVLFSGMSRSSPGENEYGPLHSGSMLWKAAPPPAKPKAIRAASPADTRPSRLAGSNEKRPLRL